MQDVHERWRAAMRANNFPEAWRQTDRAELLRRAGETPLQPHHLRWDGRPFDGQRVLIRCLHGLGDTLQYVRFIPALRARARAVILMVQPALLPLLTTCEELGDVRDGWTEEKPEHDVEIEIMELAYAFRATAETLPAFTLPAAGILATAPPLPIPAATEKLRVGLIWAASAWDPLRSIPPADLLPLAALRHVTFFDLQQGCDSRPPFPTELLSSHTQSVLAAAAAMLTLDLLVTVDGMSVHLAGLLGRPAWLLLRCDPDWRWGLGKRTPWYPQARLFRQRAAGEWGWVIEQIVAAFQALPRL